MISNGKFHPHPKKMKIIEPLTSNSKKNENIKKENKITTIYKNTSFLKSKANTKNLNNNNIQKINATENIYNNNIKNYKKNNLHLRNTIAINSKSNNHQKNKSKDLTLQVINKKSGNLNNQINNSSSKKLINNHSTLNKNLPYLNIHTNPNCPTEEELHKAPTMNNYNNINNHKNHNILLVDERSKYNTNYSKNNINNSNNNTNKNNTSTNNANNSNNNIILDNNNSNKSINNNNNDVIFRKKLSNTANNSRTIILINNESINHTYDKNSNRNNNRSNSRSLINNNLFNHNNNNHSTPKPSLHFKLYHKKSTSFIHLNNHHKIKLNLNSKIINFSLKRIYTDNNNNQNSLEKKLNNNNDSNSNNVLPVFQKINQNNMTIFKRKKKNITNCSPNRNLDENAESNSKRGKSAIIKRNLNIKYKLENNNCNNSNSCNTKISPLKNYNFHANLINKNNLNLNQIAKRILFKQNNKEQRPLSNINFHIKRKISNNISNINVNANNNNNENNNKIISSNTHSTEKIMKEKKLSSENSINQNNNNIHLRFLIKSNWGNSNQISFNNISLFDNLNRKINIKKSSINLNNQFISKYNQGEEKKIDIIYSDEVILNKLSITNGYSDIGICNAEIWKYNENNKNKSINLWKGIIPKTKIIKPFIININSNIGNNLISNTNKTNRVIVNKKIRKIFNSNNVSSNNINNLTITKKSSRALAQISLKNKLNIEINPLKEEIHSNISKYLNNSIIKNYNTTNNNDLDVKSNILDKSNNNISSKNINTDIPNGIYVTCNKIRIFFLSNYGSNKFIGLTGIVLIDSNNKIISYNMYLKSIISNFPIQNNKSLENIISPKNETNNIKYMFYTESENMNNNNSDKKYSRSTSKNYIEINFNSLINIKQIIIYNFNCKNKLDYAAKEIKIGFYKDNNKIYSSDKLLLFKPPGEDCIDYSQSFTFPMKQNFLVNTKEFFDKIIYYYNNCISKLIFNYNYYSPILPIGFIIKIEFFGTYDENEEYIAIDEIDIFDINDKSVFNNYICKIYSFPDRQILSRDGKKPFFLNEYCSWDKKGFDNKLGYMRIIYIFDEIICISKIIFYCYQNMPEINAKFIKIFIDDKIIYEGQINQNSDSSIYFSDNQIFKKFDANNNIDNNYSEENIHEEQSIDNDKLANINDRYECLQEGNARIIRIKK